MECAPEAKRLHVETRTRIQRHLLQGGADPGVGDTVNDDEANAHGGGERLLAQNRHDVNSLRRSLSIVRKRMEGTDMLEAARDARLFGF
jgi:hypothetical protein